MEGRLQERRRKLRFPVQLPIVVLPSGERIDEIRGVTRDVSTRGVFFYVSGEWQLEEASIEFRIFLPEELVLAKNRRAVCRGRVFRVERGLPVNRTGIAATIDSYALG